MDKITTIRIKYGENNYSSEIPIGVFADAVEWADGYSLRQIIGDGVNLNTKGSLQSQLDSKMSNIDFANKISDIVGNWLNIFYTNHSGAITTDQNLNTQYAAADAKVTGDWIEKIGKALIKLAYNEASGDKIVNIENKSNSQTGDGYSFSFQIQNGDTTEIVYGIQNAITRVNTLLNSTKNNLESLTEQINNFEIPNNSITKEKINNNFLSELIFCNSLNLLKKGTNRTAGNLSYIWNDDGSCTVNGSYGSGTVVYMAGDSNGDTIPEGFIPGETYNLIYDNSRSDNTGVHVQISFFNENDNFSTLRFYKSGSFTIPNNITGMSIALRVSGGVQIDNETVHATIFNTKTNKQLATDIEDISENIDDINGIINDINNSLDDINASLGDILNSDASNLKLSIPTVRIESGANLDDYIEDGRYIVKYSADARHIDNMPEQKIGRLLVFHLTVKTASSNNLIQMYISKTPKIYIRYFPVDDSFGPWIELQTNNNNNNNNNNDNNDNNNNEPEENSNNFSWIKKQQFIIHNPEEESRYMISVISDVLNLDIDSTRDWVKEVSQSPLTRFIPSKKIYDLWDYLQETYPDYIDEGEIIAYSLDTEGEQYAPVKAYYIHPKKSYTKGAYTFTIDYNNLPTIYMVAGTHGGQSSPTWTMFSIFARAFLNGTVYSDLLDGMCYRVIPVLDRWSYDNKKRYLAAAYDSNGNIRPSALGDNNTILDIYDCNRQMRCIDDTNPSYATLNMFSYATEAIGLVNYAYEHNFGDILGDSFLDLHNCSSSLGYLSTMNPKIASMFNIMMDTLNKDWRNYATFANGDPVDYYSSSTGNHTVLSGKILGRIPSSTNSNAWFFSEAFNSFTSNTLEVQQGDDGVCNQYALAKCADITFRWMKVVVEKIRLLKFIKMAVDDNLLI